MRGAINLNGTVRFGELDIGRRFTVAAERIRGEWRPGSPSKVYIREPRGSAMREGGGYHTRFAPETRCYLAD